MKQSNSPRWPREWTAQVGRAVVRCRKQQGVSAARLSELCAEAGFPIPRNTITNLENGRKEALPVHEVVVLAEALKVSPADLLFPAGTDETVLTARGEQDIVTTALWFSGAGYVADSELSLYVDHSVRVTRIQTLFLDETRPGWQDRLSTEVGALAVQRELMAERRLRLPELPQRVSDLLTDASMRVRARMGLADG